MTAIPKVRRPRQAEDTELPRWWFYDQPVSTHRLSALMLVLPHAERFMLDTVRPRMGELERTHPLRAQLRAFCAQEAMHAREHQLAEPLLEAQGFELDRLIAPVEHTFAGLARLPNRARLAITVGMEHLGAIIGAYLLQGGHTAYVHPRMRSLVEWHAAEEIEHRAVTFDLWRAIGGGWLGRVLGLMVAMTVLVGAWAVVYRRLVRQDDQVTPEALQRAQQHRQELDRGGRPFLRAIRTFLRPGFHPSELDDDHLVERFLGAAQAA